MGIKGRDGPWDSKNHSSSIVFYLRRIAGPMQVACMLDLSFGAAVRKDDLKFTRATVSVTEYFRTTVDKTTWFQIRER